MSEAVLELIPLGLLDCQPQVRRHLDDESIAGLAQSLREVGLLQPIRVRREGDRFVIVDGERRWRAAQLVGLTHLDALVESQSLSPAGVAQRQLIANCQRDDLHPLELAAALDQLLQTTGWSASQVAAKLGFSNAKVSRLLTLQTLPEDVRARVAAGEVGVSAACELARVGDAQTRTALTSEVAAGRLTRDGLATRRKRKPPEFAPRETPSRVTAQLSAGRCVTLAGPGLNGLDALVNWLSELLAEARRARTQNLELATFVRMLRDRANAEGA